MTNFNDLLKSARLAHRATLRQCASDLGVDPSNWSKLERGVNPAPKDNDLLVKWMDYFGLKGEERAYFIDAAALSRKEIPGDIAGSEKLMAALPVFFRSLRDSDTSDEKLSAFVEDLKKLHTPDSNF